MVPPRADLLCMRRFLSLALVALAASVAALAGSGERHGPGERPVVRRRRERLAGIRVRGAPGDEGRARHPRHDHPDRGSERRRRARRRLDRRRRPGPGRERPDALAPGRRRLDARHADDGLRRDHPRRPGAGVRSAPPGRRRSARATGWRCSRWRAGRTGGASGSTAQAVTEPVLLENSTNRWRPIATAESWNGGRRSATRSPSASTASASPPRPAARGVPFAPGFKFLDRGFGVKRLSAAPGAQRTLSGGAPAPYAFEASSL